MTLAKISFPVLSQMQQDFSWKNPVKKMADLYRPLPGN